MFPRGSSTMDKTNRSRKALGGHGYYFVHEIDRMIDNLPEDGTTIEALATADEFQTNLTSVLFPWTNIYAGFIFENRRSEEQIFIGKSSTVGDDCVRGVNKTGAQPILLGDWFDLVGMGFRTKSTTNQNGTATTVDYGYDNPVLVSGTSAINLLWVLSHEEGKKDELMYVTAYTQGTGDATLTIERNVLFNRPDDVTYDIAVGDILIVQAIKWDNPRDETVGGDYTLFDWYNLGIKSDINIDGLGDLILIEENNHGLIESLDIPEDKRMTMELFNLIDYKDMTYKKTQMSNDQTQEAYSGNNNLYDSVKKFALYVKSARTGHGMLFPEVVNVGPRNQFFRRDQTTYPVVLRSAKSGTFRKCPFVHYIKRSG